jgi:predicted transcriptional regulator
MELFETASTEMDINDSRQNMKLTQSKMVRDIVRPPIMGMPPQPSVEMSSSIVQAVELMVKNDVFMIAVASDNRLIGHISLTDALEYLGIHIPGSSSGRKKKQEER